MRVLLAFLIVPALLPFAYFGFFAATVGQSSADAALMLKVVLPLSYIAVLGLGFPAHLALSAAQLNRFSMYILTGLAIALVAYLAYFDVLAANWRLWVGSMEGRNMAPLSHMVHGLVLWWAAGAATGALFWIFAQPDRGRNRSSNLSTVMANGMHRSAQ